MNKTATKYDKIAWVVPIGLIVIGSMSLYLWLRQPAIELAERVPYTQDALQTPSDETFGKIQGELIQFGGQPADLPGAWPRFRGADYDAISKEEIALARNWPPGGPKVLWSINVGEGYAGAAILNGRVYIIDYDQKKQADAIRCLSFADGQEIWRYSYPVKIKRNHGMSRTVPAVTDKYIVTMGPKCHVTCLDSMTGQFRWMLDLVKDYNATVPDWYAGQCPLIDDDKAIIAAGGDALMMAVDCEAGDILWQSHNPHNWLMTHSSVMPVVFGNKRMYAYCASRGVTGISAEDGSILWEYPGWTIRTANVPSPLVVGDGLIFLCGDYNAGSMMLKLTQQGDKIIAEPAFRLGPEIFGSPQQTPIFYKGYIYGTNAGNELACLNLDGKVLWTSTSAHKFGRGPYIIADGLIYVMNDDGVLTMVEATPTGYKQLASAKVLEGPDAWGPMAIAAGRLILRDLNRMICLDIAEQ
jgi:outer membrane protein assembly factor BamB